MSFMSADTFLGITVMEEDLGLYLSDFVSTLDNVPSEIVFLLRELRLKDEQYLSVRRRIQARDTELSRLLRTPVPSSVDVEKYIRERTLKENDINRGIARDYDEARQLADDKIKVAGKVTELLNKHASRLEEDLERFSQFDIGGDEVYGYGGSLSWAGTMTPGGGGRYNEEYYGDGSTTRRRTQLQKSAQKKKAVQVDTRKKVVEERDDYYEDENGEVDDTLYCFCRQISFGQMVACDNGDNCPYEWFHFECVGLTEQPKGSWYCSDCAMKLKK